MGQSLPGARSSALAIRACAHPRDLRRQAAHGRRVVHTDGDARLVTGSLPSKSGQLTSHLFARLPARPSARLGASVQNDEAGERRPFASAYGLRYFTGVSPSSSTRASHRPSAHAPSSAVSTSGSSAASAPPASTTHIALLRGINVGGHRQV